MTKYKKRVYVDEDTWNRILGLTVDSGATSDIERLRLVVMKAEGWKVTAPPKADTACKGITKEDMEILLSDLKKGY